MQSIRILLFLFILCLGCGKQTENTTRAVIPSTYHTPLFQITENDKIGFIDSTGRVAIPPQFRSAGEFSEGLASARLSGTYGYIDATGTFIIPPQFDYATPFSGGLAVVYRNGMPSYIHPNGEQAFECTFPAVGAFENGRALVLTASKKYGMIDTHGKLFIDTVYSEIRPFIDGRAVVKSAGERNEVGVIDTLGRRIILYHPMWIFASPGPWLKMNLKAKDLSEIIWVTIALDIPFHISKFTKSTTAPIHFGILQWSVDRLRKILLLDI